MKKVLLQELEYLGGQLREESIRCDRLEEQMNDLTELHQVCRNDDVDGGGVFNGGVVVLLLLSVLEKHESWSSVQIKISHFRTKWNW